MTGSYRDAGVDIDAAARAKTLMAAAVRSTHSAAVLSSIGSFGGCFDAELALVDVEAPVLVSSTDGVGTKTMVAAALGRYDTVGQDLVNHCINDILVQGARPLFFLDYVAAAHLEPAMIADVVGGVARACQESGCALLGGETAEMPGVYVEGAFDLAGTIVGVAPRREMLPRADVAPGDAILALPSSGLHTNGYSLARRIAAMVGYDARPDALSGQSVGEALLAVHRSYLRDVTALRAAAPIKALAHITGGGVFDNLPRVLPPNLGAEIVRGAWPIPPICDFLVKHGNVVEPEAYRVFNMGLGMLAVIASESVDVALAAELEIYRVGQVVTGNGVRLRDAV